MAILICAFLVNNGARNNGAFSVIFVILIWGRGSLCLGLVSTFKSAYFIFHYVVIGSFLEKCWKQFMYFVKHPSTEESFFVSKLRFVPKRQSQSRSCCPSFAHLFSNPNFGLVFIQYYM